MYNQESPFGESQVTYTGRNKSYKGLARYWRRNPHPAEKKLQLALQQDSRFSLLRWIRQKVYSGKVIDFFFPMKALAVEIDGPNHKWKIRQYKDEVKSYLLRKEGIQEIRFTNEDVFNRPDWVLNAIYDKYQGLPITPKDSVRFRELVEEKSKFSYIKEPPNAV